MTTVSSRISPRAALLGLAALSFVVLASTARAENLGPPSINLPLGQWESVALKKGFFKEEYDKIGTTTITLLNPGTSELSGAESAMLDRGGLAIAQRMMYPATVHRAGGLDAVVIWQSGPSNPYRTPVLALKNASYQSVNDLDGLSIGSSRVGCGWTSPKEIFDTANVPLTTRIRNGSVRHETIVSAATVNSALLSGRIAATATHVSLPAPAALWTSGEVKVIGRSPSDGVYVNAAGRVSYFAMRSFAEKYPAAIQAYLNAREKTKAWIHDNVDESAEIIATQLRLPVHIAKFMITDESAFDLIEGEPSADNAKQAIRTFQKYYIEHGDDILAERSLSDEQIEAFVDARFFAGGSHSVYR